MVKTRAATSTVEVSVILNFITEDGWINHDSRRLDDDDIVELLEKNKVECSLFRTSLQSLISSNKK